MAPGLSDQADVFTEQPLAVEYKSLWVRFARLYSRDIVAIGGEDGELTILAPSYTNYRENNAEQY